MFRRLVTRLLLLLLVPLTVHSLLQAARFGNDYTTGYAESYGYGRALVIPTYAYNVTGNIVIDSLFIYGRTAVGTGSIGIAIYQVRNGLATNRLLLRTIPLTYSGGGSNWCAIACTLSVTAPDTICLAYGNPVSINNYERVGKRDSTSGIHGTDAQVDSSMSNPWVHNFWSVQMPCMYAVYHTAGGATIEPSARRRRQ